MAKCAQCGKSCSPEISFNWTDGVLYLCSKKCLEESKSWRLPKPKERKQE
jgi:hypothetical protein